jgi:hypothetical protein
MMSESIPLRFAEPGQVVRLRELTGRDEYSVDDVDTASAIDLLSKLLRHPMETQTNVRAVELVGSDRDRLLAAVYKHAFGDRIESTLSCVRCGEPFDLDFSLQQLVESINSANQSGELTNLAPGQFETAQGLKFRLPTGQDELAIARTSVAEAESLLFARCVEGSAAPEERIAFEELLEQVAPLIDLELLANCAECGHVHTVQFDIQTYLLGALLSERRSLLSDINCIARAYSWTLDEILSLTRSDRRHLVELIENVSVA